MENSLPIRMRWGIVQRFINNLVKEMIDAVRCVAKVGLVSTLAAVFLIDYSKSSTLVADTDSYTGG